MLGFGLGSLEGAGQDSYLGVMNFLGHLGVRKVLINQNAFNQLGVLNASSSFLLNFDEVEVDILPLKVSYS